MRKIIFALIILPFLASAQNQEPTDSIEVQTLDEVVVEGATQYTSANKTTYLPDSNSKRTARNAADLLARMGIPQITVNPGSGEVTTNNGKKVAIYIDYEPASEEEKNALNPGDVKKVEYLIFPTDPRFDNNNYVVNIILNHYDYGGYLKISGTGNIMSGSGNGQAYVKTSYKKMTYDLNFSDKYTSIGHTGTTQEQVFRFPDKSGVISEVTRKTTLDDSRYKQNYIWGSFRARYDSEKTTISNTLNLISNNTPHNDYSGRVIFSSPDLLGHNSIESPYANLSNIKSFNPYWVGNYYFDLGKDWKLNIRPYFDYTRTISERFYKSDDAAITTNANEDLIITSLNASFSKTFRDKHTITAYLYGLYTHDKIKYTGNTSTNPTFNQYAFTILPNYTFGTSKLYASAAAGVMFESNTISGIKTNSIAPIINFAVSYSPNDKNQFELSADYLADGGNMADKTPDIFQVNELLYQTGNPKLKNLDFLHIDFSYTFLPNNNFSLSAFTQIYRPFHFLTPVFEPNGPDGLMLRSLTNEGKYFFTHIGVSPSLKLFNRSLVLGGQFRFVYERLSGVYSETNAYPICWLNATYYLKNWYFSAYYNMAHKFIVEGDNNYTMRRNKDQYSFNIGWSNNSWNISISAINIFRRNWVQQTSWLSGKWFDQKTHVYSANVHQKIMISASYTFNFGKKINHGDELQNSGGSSSAIMK